MRGLSDRIAIVVGGGTTIGQSVAETLAGYGADVVIADSRRRAGARSHRPDGGLASKRVIPACKTNKFSHQLRLMEFAPGADEKAKLASSFVYLPNRKLDQPSRSIRCFR